MGKMTSSLRSEKSSLTQPESIVTRLWIYCSLLNLKMLNFHSQMFEPFATLLVEDSPIFYAFMTHWDGTLIPPYARTLSLNGCNKSAALKPVRCIEPSIWELE